MRAGSIASGPRSSRPPPRLGVVIASRDPMNAILDLDKKRGRFSGGLAFSTVAQALFFIGVTLVTQWGLLTWTHRVQAQVRERLRAVYEIEIREEPPPPEPPKEDAPPDPAPAVVQPRQVAPPPVGRLTQAEHVLTREPDPGHVEDMTNTIVDGSGQGGGGMTGTNGTGAGFGTGPAPTGVPGGTGTAPPPPPPPPPPPTVDRSKQAGLRGSSEWRCPWPAEADAAQVDEAFVTVSVIVKPDGTAQTVNVTNDPGYGFGRAARGCAMREKYTPALDRDGNAIGGPTRAFRIHFSR